MLDDVKIDDPDPPDPEQAEILHDLVSQGTHAEHERRGACEPRLVPPRDQAVPVEAVLAKVDGDTVVVCRTVVVTIVVAVDVEGPVVDGEVVVTTVVVTTVVDEGVVVTTVDSTTAPPPGVCAATGAAGVVTDIWFDSGLVPKDVSARSFTS